MDPEKQTTAQATDKPMKRLPTFICAGFFLAMIITVAVLIFVYFPTINSTINSISGSSSTANNQLAANAAISSLPPLFANFTPNISLSGGTTNFQLMTAAASFPGYVTDDAFKTNLFYYSDGENKCFSQASVSGVAPSQIQNMINGFSLPFCPHEVLPVPLFFGDQLAAAPSTVTSTEIGVTITSAYAGTTPYYGGTGPVRMYYFRTNTAMLILQMCNYNAEPLQVLSWNLGSGGYMVGLAFGVAVTGACITVPVASNLMVTSGGIQVNGSPTRADFSVYTIALPLF